MHTTREATDTDSARALGVANAGLVLAATLFAWAWIEAARSPSQMATDCPNPVETAAEGGWTRAVRCAEAPETEHPVRGPARLLFGRPIDLNRADARTLESLPGIGPGRARAIVEARSEGLFEHLDDLRRVPGIGPRTVDGLRGWATVGSVPPSEAPARSGPAGP